jgi:diguanylate cyclase (GGDEF)-like protein
MTSHPGGTGPSVPTPRAAAWAGHDPDVPEQFREAPALPHPQAVGAACDLVDSLIEQDPARADRMAETVLSRIADDDPVPVATRALRTASRTAYRVGDYDRAVRHAERLLRLGRRTADPAALGWARACLAYVEYEHGRYGHALDLCLQAIASFRGCEAERESTARMLVLAGATHGRLGMVSTGLALFREAREIFRLLGDETWVQRLTGNIAIAFRQLGEYEAALDALAGSDRAGCGILLDEVKAQLALVAGELTEARALFERSLAANLRPDGTPRKPEQYAQASVGLAQTLLRQGDPAGAAEVLREPLRRARDLDVPAHLESVHGVLADVYAAVGDYRAAYGHAVEQRAAAARMVDHRTLDSVQAVRVEHAVAAARAEADRLREMARRDVLTDLLNRRAIEDWLAGASLDPTSAPVVAVIDVDSFKQVNDRHTHVVGDRVLQTVARLLRSTLDDRHMVARLGGDEFLVVFDQVTEAEAGRLCEAVRLSVASYPWQRIALGLNISISVGAAPVVKGHQLGEVIGAADRRLLRAKRRGRNRVVA